MTKLLIDGDLVAFRCAASAENDNEAIAISRVEESIRQICEALGTMDFTIFLTGPDNFRKEICPDYKANRKDKPKPKFLSACADFLIENYGAVRCTGHEADDALGYSQTKDTIIVSYDKDLRQIAGKHYDFTKGELTTVEEKRGLRTFYEQMLIGDKGDNIVGVAGIGKAKAPRYLEGCETEEEMFDVVRELYNDDMRFLRNGQLLWIWKTKGGIWNTPLLSKLEGSIKQSEAIESESMLEMEAESIHYMEPIGTNTTNNGTPASGPSTDST